MFFKKLEIIGFKSFFHKTTLNFEPGITAVVGPNGCGKSNIFDAIRWVLGEQSVKSLRGSDMQDVIFNGTDKKEPLSMAEVTLTFDNSTRFFGLDHDDLAITRRIFRSGESEYLLNKTQVRLKDILDLLMGTGIGAESYSLVAQGKIDLILSSRPEDRRLVFDEAAGITKYKTQKKEAQRRLEETEQNLLRVNDIISEVKRQIGSLERQANKARRYQEVFEELKSKEAGLAFLQKKELEKQKEVIRDELEALKIKESQALSAIAQQESLINSHSQELKTFEDNILDVKNQLLNLENVISRGKERIVFNRERIGELEADKGYLQDQTGQTKNRLIADEEKFNNLKKEYEGLNQLILEKTKFLNEKEIQFNTIASSIKASLENIACAKKTILDLAARISVKKNEIADLFSKQQIYLARKKRLEIEKAKLNEEGAAVEGNLAAMNNDAQVQEADFQDLSCRIRDKETEAARETKLLASINLEINSLEKQSQSLYSHKDFLDKLKNEYEEIGESMNALIYLDKMPNQRLTGLVLKIKEYLTLDDKERQASAVVNFKLSGEAKPIDLDTTKVSEKIEQLGQQLESLKNTKSEKERQIQQLTALALEWKENLREKEISLANKKVQLSGIKEQFDKIKEEQEIINLELDDVEKELSSLNENSLQLKPILSALESEEKTNTDLIHQEQDNISTNNHLKEEAVVLVAKTKSEIESLNRRLSSDRDTLSILGDTCRQDKEVIAALEKQIGQNLGKSEALSLEIGQLEVQIQVAQQNIQVENLSLKQLQEKYKETFGGQGELLKKIEADRTKLDSLKNGMHELEMNAQEADYKYLNIKERIMQAYKIDLERLVEMPQEADQNIYAEEIKNLKIKIDSYGTVNLVAIEEYDELKKRYDFLTQQQNDLVSAKESLHEAILKINRTTKQMFMDTFQKVREEFRNYFRLLFNGGDAQVFLIDEQDPLESGIEIICRPQGKKLQNVLLLSGGERSMAAIALIFAIFKVKPAPFCVLDEIDAALDEANVDRYSRLLQEFARDSQFIAITHNKKTISNADVMYGITMEESGVSKIVSVKFAKESKPIRDNEPDMVAA